MISSPLEFYYNTDNRKTLIFSPHPDDDVIGCGGLMMHLGENFDIGNDLKVAYCTSGEGGLSTKSEDKKEYLMDFVR